MSNLLRNNKKFSTLFSTKAVIVNQIFNAAVKNLNLPTSFCSIEENYKEILRNNTSLPIAGPENSKIFSVPGNGDCCIIALLAPLLGYIIDRKVSSLICLLPHLYSRFCMEFGLKEEPK